MVFSSILSTVQIAGFQRHELTGDDKKTCVGMLFSMMKLQRARNKDAFPGSNPVSIERSMIPRLNAESYWAAQKTDGERALLMAVTLKNDRLCVMVDRAMRMFIIPGELPTSSFESSLMDGEIVKYADGTWMYLIFDCVHLAGIDISTHQFTTRLDLVRSWLLDIGRGLENLKVELKKFAEVGSEVLPVEEGMPEDGLIFVPEFRPYGCYKNESLMKWKTKQKNTVDFKVQEQKLMVLSKSKLVEKAKLHADDVAMTGDIVECHLHAGIWRVLKKRHDKTMPNDLYVMNKTVLNIQEDIQRCELGI